MIFNICVYITLECSDPDPIYLGHIDIPKNLKEGAKANYSCPDRYKLVGDDTLTCVAGKWVGNVPYCQGMVIMLFI